MAQILIIFLGVTAAAWVGMFLGLRAMLRSVGRSLFGWSALLVIVLAWCGAAIWCWIAMDLFKPVGFTPEGGFPTITDVVYLPLWLVFLAPSFVYLATVLAHCPRGALCDFLRSLRALPASPHRVYVLGACIIILALIARLISWLRWG